MKMMIYWSRYNWSPFIDSTINTQQRFVNKALCRPRPTNVRLHLLTLILWLKTTKRQTKTKTKTKTLKNKSRDQDSSLDNHDCESCIGPNHWSHMWQMQKEELYRIRHGKWQLTLWRPQSPYWYSYKASCARPGYAVVCNFWHPGTLTLRTERQSARMSKITNDGLTRSGTGGCFIAVPVWQQWASKG